MSDSLKQAVEGMEAAWRRLRDVLDGPDVAAALVVRHMADAPRDGTFVYLDFGDGRGTPCVKWDYPAGHTGGLTWVDNHGVNMLQPGRVPVGWWPAPTAPKAEVQPMSTAPRDGKPITLHHVWGDRIQALYHVGYRGWVDRQNNLLREEGEFIGWSPVK